MGFAESEMEERAMVENKLTITALKAKLERLQKQHNHLSAYLRIAEGDDLLSVIKSISERGDDATGILQKLLAENAIEASQVQKVTDFLMAHNAYPKGGRT